MSLTKWPWYVPVLHKVQGQVHPAKFQQLSYFLQQPEWEATNNGAERAGRTFRHRQAPHFNLRSKEAIDGGSLQTSITQSPSPALTSPPVPLPTSIVEPEANTQSDQNRPPAPPQRQSPYRPASNHPWCGSPIGRARFQTNNFSKN